VESDVRARILDVVIPAIAAGLIEHGSSGLRIAGQPDETALEACRRCAIVLLYRLLFLFHAEDRGVLPLGGRGSCDSLRGLAEEVAGVVGDAAADRQQRIERAYAAEAFDLHERLDGLFRKAAAEVGETDPPPCPGAGIMGNGDEPGAPVHRRSDRWRVPDRRLALAIDELARGRDECGAEVRRIDYASLPVRHLGAIYERLLESRLVVGPAATHDESARASRAVHLHLEVDRRARKASGSYYTPDLLVKRIVEETVGPVLDRKLDALRPDIRCAAGDRDRRAASDLVDRCFDIRVLDPAMGTGHFLVEVVNLITRRVLMFMEDCPNDPITAMLDGARGRAIPSAYSRDGRIDDGPLRRIQLLKQYVVERCVYGVDVDPFASELARISLWLDAATPGLPLRSLDHHLRCGDSLVGSSIPELEKAPAGGGRCRPPERTGFDAVVGNPPFQNQLETATTHPREVAALLRTRFGEALRPYTDTSAIFLLQGFRLLTGGGRVGMIQPQSLLGARDAEPIRRELSSRGILAGLWVSGEPVFDDASTHVCAPIVEKRVQRGGAGLVLRRWVGRTWRVVPELPLEATRVSPAWGCLIADAFGVPAVRVRTAQTIGRLASVTADFRDQYYGLSGAIVEDAADGSEDLPRLITTGLVDLAECRWGNAPTRIHKRRWERPRVDPARVPENLHPWLARRLVPKVLLATQTRVLEAIVDETGDMLPVVPLITIVPAERETLWHVAAAVTSPVATLDACRESMGTALVPEAIKLSATQVAALPAPDRCDAWDNAAEAFRDATGARSDRDRTRRLQDSAAAMCEAFGVVGEDRAGLLEWWRARWSR